MARRKKQLHKLKVRKNVLKNIKRLSENQRIISELKKVYEKS